MHFTLIVLAEEIGAYRRPCHLTSQGLRRLYSGPKLKRYSWPTIIIEVKYGYLKIDY